MKKKIITVLAGLLSMSAVIASATVPVDNIAIDNVAPGTNIETAKQKLGTPTQQGDKFFFPNGVVIEVDEHNPSIVEDIATHSGGVTPAGIAVGMEEARITQTYGEPDKLDKDQDDTEYIYYSTDNTKKMEFKVINGKVAKIKCEMR